MGDFKSRNINKNQEKYLKIILLKDMSGFELARFGIVDYENENEDNDRF